MCPLYIKMRPEDNVTVDVRDLTASESLIMLDYASNSRTDSAGDALEYVVQHSNAPEHDNDDDMQPVCDSLQPSSSNELYDSAKVVSDSNEMCNPETSVESTKTHVITDTREHEIKYSDFIEHCDTSQIESSEPNSDLDLSVPENITACSVQSPDSSTTVDKLDKSVLNKEKLAAVRKPKIKSKFNVNNFVKSRASKKVRVVEQIAEQSNITENTSSSNVDSEKEMCNLKNRNTKSRRKVRKDPSTSESKTKLLPNKEQSILEDTKESKRKKVTKSIVKPKMNLDKNEETVTVESRIEEKSSLEDIEYPGGPYTGNSRRKSTSKLKYKQNSVEIDESMEPAVENATDKKSKKKKIERTKQKTEPKLKWKMKLRNRVAKASRKYVIDDTSDEEIPVESSTAEVSSKLDKNNDVPKKTDKEHMQKDFDMPSGKTILKKKNRLDEKRQTTAPTEHFDVGSKADEKQSSKLKNSELKLPTLPVTIKTQKLKSLPKIFKKCRATLKNKEQRVLSKEFVEQQNTAVKHVKVSENWNMHRLSPIPRITETLQQRWAETGLIDPLAEDFYDELRRRRSQLTLPETSSRDNQTSNGNPVANLSKPSSLGENKQDKSYLAVPGITKLPVKENMKPHKPIQTDRPMSFVPRKETSIAHEPLVVDGITKIIPSSETSASNNCATLAREVALPTPFLIPAVPPRKKIRTNTNVEEQTQPSKTNDCESYEDDEDGMSKEIQNTSEECAARNKHHFNFVDLTATPTGTKRIQKIKITRPDMSDIPISNVKRKPIEDDSISIYAESLRTDSMSVRNDCDFDNRDNGMSPLNTNNIVSEWIRHTRAHSTEKVTPKNTNNKQIDDRVRPFKYPRINYNMVAEDAPLPPISNSVDNSLYIFDDICRTVLKHGICKQLKCGFKHALPQDWEVTLQKMPKESLQNLYNNIKNRMYLCIFKKMFPIVVKQLVVHRDFNSVIRLVKDVLEINMDTDRTQHINIIIDALRSIGMTFTSVIDVIFNSIFVADELKDQLTDILLNNCMEQRDIVTSWPTIQVLMNYRNYHVDAGIIQTILQKCLIKNKLQKELCLKVYSDLIPRISDTWGSRFECLIHDYIECLRTLGLVKEAQALSVQSSRSSGSGTRPVVPLFNVPPSTFTQSAKHNSPSNFNAPYKCPTVNNKPNSLLKDVLADKQASNLPSAIVAPYVEEMQSNGMNTVKQAIFTDNLLQLMSLIWEYKEGDSTDEFLQTFLDAVQESAHNFAVLFRNVCQSATICQDVVMDKSLEYVLQTIGYNLIIYSTNNNEWEQAYNIYQTLLDLYDESDVKNIKMYMVDKPSSIVRLLIICKIFIKNNDCGHAWELFKVNTLHTSRCWSDEADHRDIQYRNVVFTELMTGLVNEKQWETVFTIIEYIFKNDIYELDPIVDTTIQMAVRHNCNAEYITSLMSDCPGWYNRVHCYTFRVIVVKLVRDQMYRMARTVYRQGCQMNIYPQFDGNETCLVVSTHYVLEEILLMLKVFLHNMLSFMPVRHAVVIKVDDSADQIDESGRELPSLLHQYKASVETMHVRIVNILNNHIKPPIRVVNKYSQLEIMPAELGKHLETRRTWNKFC